jgi:hypothetical protein
MPAPYDGKVIHRFMTASQAEFAVHGNRIYRCPVAGLPEYEIRGDWVYRFMSASQPVFQIRQGRFLHASFGAGVAVYELR